MTNLHSQVQKRNFEEKLWLSETSSFFEAIRNHTIKFWTFGEKFRQRYQNLNLESTWRVCGKNFSPSKPWILNYRNASYKNRDSTETFRQGVKTALSSPVEQFENEVVFWKKSCFLFTLWTWSGLSIWILAEVSSRFVQIAILSRVQLIGNGFFSKQSISFSSFDFREKNYPTFEAGPAKLSKLHSIRSRSRFEKH